MPAVGIDHRPMRGVPEQLAPADCGRLGQALAEVLGAISGSDTPMVAGA